MRTAPPPRRVALSEGELRRLALVLLVAFAAGCGAADDVTPYDYVLTDARFLQGGSFSEPGYFVAVRGERIAYIGREPVSARRQISVSGLLVTPGFLDTNIVGLPERSGQVLKLFDGVTSALSAHGNTLERSSDASFINFALTLAVGKDLASRGGERMIEVLKHGIAAGAYGVALSVEYNAHQTLELVEEICRAFAGRNIPLSFHTRYSSSEREHAGVEEALACARLDVPVHLLHLNSTGGTFSPARAVQAIDDARAAGQTVIFDFYPYTYWSSSIARSRFDGDWRSRYRVDFDDVTLAGHPGLRLGAEIFEALRASQQHYHAFVESIPLETIDFFALETDAPIGTDTSPGYATSHPRGAGAFAKFFEDYVHSGRIPPAEAFHRFSTRAHATFAPYVPGLRERGRIEEGAFADLVVWDLDSIRSHASKNDPSAQSSGVAYAFVNGALQIDGGQLAREAHPTGRWLPGRQLH